MEQASDMPDFTALVILAVAVMDLVIAFFFYQRVQPYLTGSSPATGKVVKAHPAGKDGQLIDVTYQDGLKQEHTITTRHGGMQAAKDGDTVELLYLKSDPGKAMTVSAFKSAKLLPLVMVASAGILVVFTIVAVATGIFPSPF